MRQVGLALALAAIAILLWARLAHRSSEQPDDARPPTLVDDRVALLSGEHRSRIAEYHEALRESHDIDYRVLATDDAEDIAHAAHRHFGDVRVGELSTSGRGLLLVIDPARRRVRLEVSTSLESAYTDAFVSYVQNRQMAPFFRAGRVADGIVATTELIVSRAQEAEAGNEFSPAMPAASGGGGATAIAGIGTENELPPSNPAQPEIRAAGLDPVQVVNAYLHAMERRDARPDLAIYSTETAQMLRGWVMTPAQMSNVAKQYRRCAVDRILTQGERAVVRYSVTQRQCAPYFLRRERGAWKLDLAAASSEIRFNHENEWRLAVGPGDLEYGFAFEDWRFDSKGFPIGS